MNSSNSSNHTDPTQLPSTLEALSQNQQNKHIIKGKIAQNADNKKIMYSTAATLFPIGLAALFPLAGVQLLLGSALIHKLIKTKKLTLELENNERIQISNIANLAPSLIDAMEKNNTVVFVENDNNIEDAVILPTEHENSIDKYVRLLSENNKIFFNNNGIWTIRYNNDFVQIKDFKGPNYIHYLLQKSNKHIGLAELYHAVNGGDLPTLEGIIDGHTVDKNQVREEIFTNINLLREAIETLDNRYDNAEIDDNEPLMIKIDKERESIEAEIKFLEGKKYYAPRNISKERKKISNLIRKSFSDFYKQINTLENLHLHLHDSIKVENGYKYIKEDITTPWLINY